mgnify:FL=1
MANKNESLIRYVVITTYGYWGKAPELIDALKNAGVNSFYALNSKKRGNACHIYRIELDPVESVFNEQSKSALSQNGVSLDDDYQDGDLIEPWVNDWGGVGTMGAKSCELVINLQIK